MQSSGSKRQYYRLWKGNQSVIGVYHPVVQESKAFITFSKHFRKHGLAVPEILSEDLDNNIYLLEDLGDQTLFDLVLKAKNNDALNKEILAFYRKAIEDLVKFQLEAGKDLDYSACYPRPVFDQQSISWDLNYFKYNFLKLAGIEFDEQGLEDDFKTLMNLLLEESMEFFMYRDFQARNILIHENRPYFIDYQGGRRGPLQYDLASLLFQVRAEIPFEIREDLLNYYIEKAGQSISINAASFTKYYYGFALLRTLQVLGAYGFRGLFERKPHFISSLALAGRNIKWLRDNAKLEIEIPELDLVLNEIINRYTAAKTDELTGQEGLSITLFSFFYKKGMPLDHTDNGGGFVFDCRILPNPGRLKEYKELTGQDKKVQNYLEDQDEVKSFLSSVNNIVEQSVNNYTSRGFSDLMINFGCTGGQHRSVFCAEKTKLFLEQNFPVKVKLVHKELA